jgi:hypothetical protein
VVTGWKRLDIEPTLIYAPSAVMKAKTISTTPTIKKKFTIDGLRKDRTTRKGWIRKLDHIVTEIVRLKESKCITCGAGGNLDCGHLFSRVAYSTRWDLVNCHAQCKACNFRHEHDAYKYTKWFIEHYGEEVYDELHRR